MDLERDAPKSSRASAHAHAAVAQDHPSGEDVSTNKASERKSKKANAKRNSGQENVVGGGINKDGDMPTLSMDESRTTSIPLSQHLSKLRVHKSKKSSEQPETVRSTTDREGGHHNQNQNNNSVRDKSNGNEVEVRPEDITLPQTFVVKCLGRRDAGGLWGIKHTRKPVDEMVAQARYVWENYSEMEATSRFPFRGLKSANFQSGANGFSIDVICEGIFGKELGGFAIVSIMQQMQHKIAETFDALYMLAKRGHNPS